MLHAWFVRRLFVYDPKFGNAAASFFSGDLPRRQILRIGAGESYEKLIDISPSQKINVAIGPDEPAILKFTFRSGQTPLAISFSQDAVLKSLLQVEGDNRSLPGLIKERCLLGIPMREIGTEMLLGTLVAGGMLFVSPGFSMDLILPIVAKFRITNMIVTPGLLIDMLDYRGIAKFDLTCLKRVIYAGGPLPAVKLKEAIERYGAIFHQAYTLKESQQVISLLSPEDHMHSGKPASLRRLTSAGEICKAVKIKIFNGKRELEKGEIGEIAIKSSGTFSSFWKRPDLNRRLLGDGWVRTGDIGFVDPGGLLYILNRKQELIYRKKHLIYPRLVEEIVHEHPAVKEACLMEDERTGKLIMAVSLRHPWRGPWLSTAKEIKTFLAGRVEEWKMPDEILHVNELPRTYSGRGNRRKLQSMLNRRKLTQKIPISLFDEFRPEKNQPSILAI